MLTTDTLSGLGRGKNGRRDGRDGRTDIHMDIRTYGHMDRQMFSKG